MLFGNKSKAYSGYTEKTMENLIMDAGVFFKNFDVKVDDYDSARENGKLIGATRGGGGFTAKATFRSIEVDGVKGNAKGLQALDKWDVSINANLLEISKEALRISLGTGIIDTVSDNVYDIITAKNCVEEDDYIDNITWVGRLSGSGQPVIIQIYNALSTDGLSLKTKDKDEAVVSMIFTGHYDARDLDTPPFAIYYPKKEVA